MEQAKKNVPVKLLKALDLSGMYMEQWMVDDLQREFLVAGRK